MRTASSTQASLLYEAALSYAERGWPVLPLVPRQKRPLSENGLLDASSDFPVVNDWWTRWPNANIGLRTGVQFDVLDVDGEVGRTSLEAKTGPGFRHSGPVSRTGRGEHWLYLPSKTANRAGLLPKVDWRGTNGYIVAPPSIHPDGHLYTWDPERDESTDLPAIPEWLAPLLVPYVDRPPRDEVRIRANPYGVGIVDIAGSLGLRPTYSGGGRYSIECPFHEGDRDPSLVLYPDNNTFYCFGCGAWGDLVNLANRRPRYKHAPS